MLRGYGRRGGVDLRTELEREVGLFRGEKEAKQSAHRGPGGCSVQGKMKLEGWEGPHLVSLVHTAALSHWEANTCFIMVGE